MARIIVDNVNKATVLRKYDEYINHLKETIGQLRSEKDSLCKKHERVIKRLLKRIKNTEDFNDTIFRSLIEYIRGNSLFQPDLELDSLLKLIDNDFPNYEDSLDLKVALRKYIKINNLGE